MNRSVQTGLTLIELMAVMAIISLLMVALIPMIQGPVQISTKIADRANLLAQYQSLFRYRAKHGHLPQKEGAEFVLAPWVEGEVERTPRQRDRYFSAALSEDPHVIALKKEHVDAIWTRFGDVTTMDTHFAGRALKGRRNMTSGREIWLATDNEDGNTYADGSVLMLMGDGSVQELTRQQQVAFGAPTDPQVEFTMEVGPDSPHPDLRKLRR